MSVTSPPAPPDDGAPRDATPSTHMPRLGFGEWLVFAVLAGLLAAANIYTTLLIGWGDTGSIVAVLAAVLLLGLISRHRPSVHTVNLGQTMVSAGGSVGFAVGSYAAVRLIEPDFAPGFWPQVVLFAAMGSLGAMIGSSVRRYMVRYFFPSGTACAVIQRSVLEETPEGERNRPLFLLKLWGLVAGLLTIPTKLTDTPEGHAFLRNLSLGPQSWRDKGVAIGVDPLYYGIGLVVGPRVGLGMLIGALAVPFWITPALAGTAHEADTGEWVKWIAIAILTLPTFATILFAYFFRTPAVVPPGFQPGRTAYRRPANSVFVYGMIGAVTALVIAITGMQVFDLPWHVTLFTILIAWPLCVVIGRVAGDTDINPVRLVAIVLLSGFFWMVSSDVIALLGMAVIAGTLAAAAVDMMQDYRTGYLVEADPTHQTTVQFFGSLAGAIVAIPVLGMLVGVSGIGPGKSLPAPGAQVWATMAKTMIEGFEPQPDLIWAIVWLSLVGSGYTFLTVWPRTAPWMPSLFGMGIGILVGIPTSAGIFLGGVLKGVISLFYAQGLTGDDRASAREEAANDTMLAGASVFAAGAILSIAIIAVHEVLKKMGLQYFYIATH